MVKLTNSFVILGAFVALFGAAAATEERSEHCDNMRKYLCTPEGKEIEMDNEQKDFKVKVFASVAHDCTDTYESEHMHPGECTKDELNKSGGFNSFNYERNEGYVGQNRHCFFRAFEQEDCQGAAQDFPNVDDNWNRCNQVFGSARRVARSLKLICQYKPPKVVTKIYPTVLTKSITSQSVYYTTYPTVLTQLSTVTP